MSRLDKKTLSKIHKLADNAHRYATHQTRSADGGDSTSIALIELNKQAVQVKSIGVKTPLKNIQAHLDRFESSLNSVVLSTGLSPRSLAGIDQQARDIDDSQKEVDEVIDTLDEIREDLGLFDAASEVDIEKAKETEKTRNHSKTKYRLLWQILLVAALVVIVWSTVITIKGAIEVSS